jgi:hypothetical protein
MIDSQTIVKRLELLRAEVSKLNAEVNAKEAEIQNLILSSGTDFENSFVRFYDGTNYVFMSVERQIIRDNGSTVVLVGSSLTLSDDPLCFQDNDDGIDFGIYKEDDEITFSTQVLEGGRIETINTITKHEMAFVVDYYLNTTKENVLRGIYNKG